MRFFLVLGLLLSALAHAEFSGRVRLENQDYVDRQPGDANQTEEAGVLEFEEHATLNENWRLRFEPHLRLSTVERAVDTPYDANLRDSFVEYRFGQTRLQVGSFIKSWEGTDGVNPMDIATVKSYRDPLNPENLGSVGVAAGGGFGESVSWDLLYVPWQTPTRLPGNQSPWWPRQTSLPLAQGNEQALLPGQPEISLAGHSTLNDALENNYGGRVQLHLAAWDVSMAFFDGLGQIPILQPSLHGNAIELLPEKVVALSNPIGLTPIEYRRRTVAGGFVHTGEGWIFRLFGRYDQPYGEGENVLLPSWSDQIAGAVEHSFTVYNQMVTVLMQYSYEDRTIRNQGALFIDDPFERAVIAGVRVPWTDSFLTYLSGLIDTAHDSSLARLNFNYKLNGHWSLDLTGEWLRGSSSSLLGLWQDNSRGQLAAIYQF